MSKKMTSRRRSKAFFAGFTTGLAAPALLVSGAFEVTGQRAGTYSVTEVWRDVGRSIKVNAASYRQRRRELDNA